jgi:hypothetical protein
MMLVCLSAAGAFAQDTATIVGTVTDTSGAVIPGAKVEVAQPARGYLRELVSNSAGEFNAPGLPIGLYTVTAEATGFEKLVHTEIALTAGQIQRVDLKLTVGQITQEVTVAGNVTTVQTENATISGVVSATQVENLNLNGRNFLALTSLVPGAVPDNSFTGGGLHLGHLNSCSDVYYDGLRAEFSNLEIDGGNNSDEASGANGGDTTPSLNSIAEFRLSTSNYGADVGQHAGPIIEVVTKSGTKDFHGNMHEFVRNDVMDANNFFLNREIAPPGGNAPKQPLKWNIYGFTFGGPFYIPNHYNTSKSKTFFFYSEEWAAYREGTTIAGTVPSLRMRQGDFGECDPNSSEANSIIISQGCTLPTNPLTHAVYAGDQVSVDPNATALLTPFIPVPNSGVDSYISARTVPENFREELIRVDQNISDKARIFVRYTHDTWERTQTPALWSDSVFDTTATRVQNPAVSAVMNLTYTFRPNLVSEFVAAFGDDPHAYLPVAGPANPINSVNKPSGWTATNLFPANSAQTLLPGISVSGGIPGSFAEDSALYPFVNSNPIPTFKEKIAWSVGKHTLKMGIYLEKYEKNEVYGAAPQGELTFSSSSAISTGNGLADMLLGRIGQYTEGSPYYNGVAVGGYNKGHYRSTQFEPYIQDDWKATRKLTLNLGLRYYYFSPLHDVSHPITDANFVPSFYNASDAPQLNLAGLLIANPNTVNYTTFGNGLEQCGKTIPTGCTHARQANIAPRFGFAYDPFGHGTSVIRGGYGIYYEPPNNISTEQMEGNPPYSLTDSNYNVLGYQNIVPGALGPDTMKAIPLYGVSTYSQQFSLGMEHQFSHNNLVSVSYVGSLGRHLPRQRNLNQVPDGVGIENAPALAGTTGCDASGNCDVQNILINNLEPTIFFAPYRGYATMNMLEPTAISNYDAVQGSLRHMVGHGLTLQLMYTYGHTLDDTSGYAQSYGTDDQHLSRWYSTSSINRTHVFQASYVYDLPFFQHTSNAFVKEVGAGWKISGITSFFSGQPVDVTCGVSGYSTGVGTQVRCNSIGRLVKQKGVFDDPQFGPTETFFNPAVVTQPYLSQFSADNQPGMFGYLGRNAIEGPGRNSSDLALLKNFPTPWFRSEHSNLQFRLETFNTFNHTQFNAISSGCSSSISFGQPCTNLGNGEATGAFSPRQIQLGLQFEF